MAIFVVASDSVRMTRGKSVLNYIYIVTRTKVFPGLDQQLVIFIQNLPSTEVLGVINQISLYVKELQHMSTQGY